MLEPWPRWRELEDRILRWRSLGVVEFENRSRAVGPRPNLAVNGYIFWTYAPLTPVEIGETEARLALTIPDPLKAFYQRSNGAHLFSRISIDGSVAQRHRDVGGPQPIDLRAGNVLRPTQSFIFGTITSYSARAKLGIWPDGQVRLINEEDLAASLKCWSTFDAFIFEEMDRLAALHDERGCFAGTYAQCFPPEAECLEKQNPSGRPDYGMG